MRRGKIDLAWEYGLHKFVLHEIHEGINAKKQFTKKFFEKNKSPFPPKKKTLRMEEFGQEKGKIGGARREAPGMINLLLDLTEACF